MIVSVGGVPSPPAIVTVQHFVTQVPVVSTPAAEEGAHIAVLALSFHKALAIGWVL